MKVNENKALINKLSIKYKVNALVIENIINHGLQSIKDCMIMDEAPNILLHNFGRFKPNKYLLENTFKSTIHYINKDEENINKIKTNNIKNYINTYERIIEEEDLEVNKELLENIKKILKKE